MNGGLVFLFFLFFLQVKDERMEANLALVGVVNLRHGAESKG